MNMKEKCTIFVVMAVGEFLSKNHESGKKMLRLENSRTFDKTLKIVVLYNDNKDICFLNHAGFLAVQNVFCIFHNNEEILLFVMKHYPYHEFV